MPPLRSVIKQIVYDHLLAPRKRGVRTPLPARCSSGVAGLRPPSSFCDATALRSGLASQNSTAPPSWALPSTHLDAVQDLPAPGGAGRLRPQTKQHALRFATASHAVLFGPPQRAALVLISPAWDIYCSEVTLVIVLLLLTLRLNPISPGFRISIRHISNFHFKTQMRCIDFND